MRSDRGLAAAQNRLFRMVRRFDQRLADRVVIDDPLTDVEEKRVRKLAAERDWEGVVDRLRRSR
jgi:hypothetical protein